MERKNMAENPYIKINGIFKKLKTAEAKQVCLYIHAPTGFGKTAAVRYYYRNKAVCYLSGKEGYLPEKPDAGEVDADAIVIDDISWITDLSSQNYIRDLVRSHGKHTILIGRNKLPKWIMDEYMSGLLLMADEKDLVMNEGHVVKLMEAYGIPVDAAAVREILDYCQGYPLGIQMACLLIFEGGGVRRKRIGGNVCPWLSLF